MTGRGYFPIKSPEDIGEALEVLKGRGLYAECWKISLWSWLLWL
jgi:hypothetical protein